MKYAPANSHLLFYLSRFKSSNLNALYKLKKKVSKPSKPPSLQTRPKAPPLQATV
jgi:hypothetical protein